MVLRDLINGLVSENMNKHRVKLAFLTLTVSIAVSIISGCVSTGSRGEQVLGMPGSPLWFRTATMQTRIDYYKPGCLAYGFKDGTPEMAQCLQSAMQSKQSANSSRRKPISCTTYGNRTNCY